MSIIYEALNKINRNFYRKGDNQQPRNFVLLLSVVAIFLGFVGSGIAVYLLFSSLAKPIPVTDNPSLPATAGLATAQKPGPLPINPASSISMPNPFKAAEKSSQAFNLKGIVESNGERVALINGEILREGDYIAGARVKRITKDAVEIFDKNKIVVLKIK